MSLKVKYIEKKQPSLILTGAARFNTSPNYVASILREERIPKRGKGLEIKKWLENELNK